MFQSSYFQLRFPVLGRVSRVFDRLLTSRGKVVFGGTLFFLVGSIHVDSPIYYLCGASSTLLFVAFVISRFFRPALDCSIEIPDQVTSGMPFVVPVSARNQGQSTFDLTFFWLFSQGQSDCFELDEGSVAKVAEVGAGERQAFQLSLTATRRGVYPCPSIGIRSSFPFDFFHCQGVCDYQVSVVVTPKFYPLKSARFLSGQLTQLGGDLGRSRSAGDQEFLTSREYVPGVPGRRWDYRAWARSGIPHLRQYEDDGSRYVSLVVDTGMCTPEVSESFEAQMSLAMSIVAQLHQMSYQLSGVAMHHGWVPLNGSPSNQMNKVSRLLALAKPTICDEASVACPQEVVGQPVILIMSEFGISQKKMLDQYAAKGHCVFPICLSEAPESTQDGAENSLNERSVRYVSIQDVAAGEVEL